MVDRFYLLITLSIFAYGILLAAAEKESNVLSKLEVVFSDTGKGLMLCYIGILLFDRDKVIDLWISICLVLVGFANLLTACIFKK